MSEVFGAESPQGAERPVLLRAAREAAGLHIAALAAALKVPVRKLEALEAGRYGELPDMTFARALASSVCRHLRVDPAPILAQIPQGGVAVLGGSRHALNAPFQPANDPAPTSAVSWLSRPALLAAIVLLLGALVIVFMPRLEETAPVEAASVVTPVEPVEPAEPAAATEPVPAQEPSPPATDGQTPAAAADQTAPAAAVPATAAGAAEAAAPAAAAAAVPGGLLHVSVTGESWIEVTNGAGAVVMQRVLQPGEAVEFSSAPPYTVVLGRAEVSQVTVRGKPFDVSRFVRNNVARFEVK